MSRSIKITKEGWYYLGMMGFVIAGAMIRDINLLYIMAGMMLGPILFSFYAALRSLRSLQLQRRFQKLVSVGEPLYVEVQASKPAGSPRGLAVVVTDELRKKGVKPQRAKLFFSEIAGHKKPVENSYCVRLHRRGQYVLGPLRAATAMPIGLVRATLSATENETVLVSPKLGVLEPAWSRHLELNNEGGQRSVRRRGQAEGDFYGLREWRNGDSRNWIHWRTTAKRGKLTVRQFEQRTNQDLVVILDLHRDTNDAADFEAIESAISFAATLVVEQCRQTATQLTIASASENGFIRQGVSSSIFRHEVMEHLAMVDATKLDQLPDLLVDVLPRATSNARVVLVTTQDRDLKDTEKFEKLWRETSARRSISEILIVDATSKEFGDLFRMDEEAAPAAKTGQAKPASNTEAVV